MKKILFSFLFVFASIAAFSQADTVITVTIGGIAVDMTDTQFRAFVRDRRVDTVFVTLNPLHADSSLPVATTVLKKEFWNVPPHMNGWKIKRVDFSVYALGQTGQNYSLQAYRLDVGRTSSFAFASTVINDTNGAGTNVDLTIGTNELFTAWVQTNSGGTPPKGVGVTYMVVRP